MVALHPISIIRTPLKRLFIIHCTLQRGGNLLFDFCGEFGIVLDELFHGIASLTEAAFAIAEPRAALLDDAEFHAEVDHFAGMGDAFAEGDFKLSLAEGGSDFVLHHFYAHLVADGVFHDAANQLESEEPVEKTGGFLGVFYKIRPRWMLDF